MDWTLEVVAVPVSDIDRAITFYRDAVGFHLDHDTTAALAASQRRKRHGNHPFRHHHRP